MAATNKMLTFKEENAEEIVKRLGLEISEKNEILNKNGEKKTCSACGTDLKADNIGVVIPGSLNFVCKNPACLSKFLAEHKEEVLGK